MVSFTHEELVKAVAAYREDLGLKPEVEFGNTQTKGLEINTENKKPALDDMVNAAKQIRDQQMHEGVVKGKNIEKSYNDIGRGLPMGR